MPGGGWAVGLEVLGLPAVRGRAVGRRGVPAGGWTPSASSVLRLSPGWVSVVAGGAAVSSLPEPFMTAHRLRRSATRSARKTIVSRATLPVRATGTAAGPGVGAAAGSWDGAPTAEGPAPSLPGDAGLPVTAAPAPAAAACSSAASVASHSPTRCCASNRVRLLSRSIASRGGNDSPFGTRLPRILTSPAPLTRTAHRSYVSRTSGKVRHAISTCSPPAATPSRPSRSSSTPRPTASSATRTSAPPRWAGCPAAPTGPRPTSPTATATPSTATPSSPRQALPSRGRHEAEARPAYRPAHPQRDDPLRHPGQGHPGPRRRRPPGERQRPQVPRLHQTRPSTTSRTSSSASTRPAGPRT
ncbi:hypothetical protein EDD98_5767 [Streptomyces sp. PanSC19]|nr:hypothetical protein EDD98_5767 [Streptomyces sp. PanSC19]